VMEPSFLARVEGQPSEVRVLNQRSCLEKRQVEPLSTEGINERETRRKAGEGGRNENT